MAKKDNGDAFSENDKPSEEFADLRDPKERQEQTSTGIGEDQRRQGATAKSQDRGPDQQEWPKVPYSSDNEYVMAQDCTVRHQAYQEGDRIILNKDELETVQNAGLKLRAVEKR